MKKESETIFGISNHRKIEIRVTRESHKQISEVVKCLLFSNFLKFILELIPFSQKVSKVLRPPVK